MLVTAPFAGPVSFPLLVAKVLGHIDFDLENSCNSDKVGDVILDSITNVAKNRREGYKIVAGIYVRMYSLLGNKESKVIYTIRQGTLADYNARLYAKITGKSVINTTLDDALSKAESGGLAIVGIEAKVGELLEEELKRLGYLAPQCVIYSRINADKVLEAYENGIRLMRERRDEASLIISSANNYYSQDIMKKIIHIYNHQLTTNKDDLRKSINVYSLVLPDVKKLEV